MTNPPSNPPLHYQPIAQTAALIRARELSPVELAHAYLDRIAAHDQTLGSYITVMADHALAQARRAETDIQAGDYKGALHGIPIAVKDIINTKDTLTSAGSRVLADNIPDHDSAIIERLNAAGAVLLGKLNLSEFAIGGTIDHPYGTPRNPWNAAHTAGGSSSGSGVAVAGGLCAAALGSDTGGSIRGPAAFCGIVGLRPTYGRVTRHGVIPMSWSMDTIGPMTRSVADCAIVLSAIAGADPRDPTSSAAPVPDYTAALTREPDIRGLRIGLPAEMLDFDGLNPEVRQAVMNAVSVLQELGASANEISLPTSPSSGAVFLTTADVDAAAYHSDRLKTRGDLYDWSTLARLESAALTPATAYIRAQRARALITAELHNALADHDALILPSGPVPAPTIAASTGRPGGYYQGSLDMARRRYTSPAALAGMPALSIPCGLSQTRLPLGLQIIAKPFAEPLLFRLARAYERTTDWQQRHPDM